jgi:hypothetical protein
LTSRRKRDIFDVVKDEPDSARWLMFVVDMVGLGDVEDEVGVEVAALSDRWVAGQPVYDTDGWGFKVKLSCSHPSVVKTSHPGKLLALRRHASTAEVGAGL